MRRLLCYLLGHRWDAPRRWKVTSEWVADYKICRRCGRIAWLHKHEDGTEFWVEDGRAMHKSERRTLRGEGIGDKERLRDALRLVLLFYTTEWTRTKQEQWRKITGKAEATTKVLCDHVRSVLRDSVEP